MISRQDNLELHLGCHTCWLSYFALVCLWCGRTVGRALHGHVITKFSRVGRFTSLWGSANARFRRARSSAITRLKYHQRTWYNALWLWRWLPHKLSKPQSMSTTVLFRNGLGYYIEDITWLRGDKKFLLECWKIFHSFAALTREIFFQHEKRNFVSPSGHVISSTCEDTKFSRESSPGISWVFI